MAGGVPGRKWLGYQDSNLGMTGSKPVALPTWLYPNTRFQVCTICLFVQICLNSVSLETSPVSLPVSGGEEKYYSFEQRNLSSVVATVAANAAPVAVR